MTEVLHFAEALLPTGWAQDVRCALAGGCIASLATGAAPQPGDTRHAVALPGLPNLHSHAFQRGMAGMGERRGAGSDSFWSWRAVMYRFLDRLSPDDVAAIAAMAYVEMLESGFTRVGEFHYLHHDPAGVPYAGAGMAGAIAAAAAESGIALTLLPVFYAHAGFGGKPPEPAQRRFITHLDSYARLREASARALEGLDGAVLGCAPHSLRASTPDELTALQELAPEGPFHLHIAEQRAEVEACLAWGGARPLDWLFDHAPVDARWCLVHATHAAAGEVARIAASGAVVGLCPITEANLGDGLFPAPAFLEAGGRFGVGSDSNVLIDAAEELRWLEYGQRLRDERRNVLAPGPDTSTGMALFSGALAGGAQALGAAAGLAVGAPADFVTLAATHPAFAGARGAAWVDRWLFAARGGGIDGVWRAGRQLVSSGRHVARERVAQRYHAVLAGLVA
jgi:formiminoglutamate deiminase